MWGVSAGVKDLTRAELLRSDRYRNIAGALRALAPTLTQPESRFELQQLAEDYDRLARFTRSVSGAQLGVERAAEKSATHAVWLILTDNSLDN
jgi:hypothetical protein